MPTQNLREREKKAKQLSGTSENNMSTRKNTSHSKSWILKALESSTNHSSGPIPAHGSRSGWQLNSALPPREKWNVHQVTKLVSLMEFIPVLQHKGNFSQTSHLTDPCACFAFSGHFQHLNIYLPNMSQTNPVTIVIRLLMGLQWKVTKFWDKKSWRCVSNRYNTWWQRVPGGSLLWSLNVFIPPWPCQGHSSAVLYDLK